MIILDEFQQAAVSHRQGPSLVAGVPGSGKSRVVVSRVVDLVHAGIRPEHILLVTFTRAACKELADRLLFLGISSVEVRTLHSLCFNSLKQVWGGLAQLQFDQHGGMIYNTRAVARALRRNGAISDSSVLDIKLLETFLSRCKNMGPVPLHGNPFNVDQFTAEQNVKTVAETWMSSRSGLSVEDCITIYQAAEERRWELGLYHYDDAQNWFFQSLLGSRELRQWWATQWSVVIVDEGQDNSPIQHSLAEMAVGFPERLTGIEGALDRDRNLMLCSDPAQSIFEWRSADPEGILYFRDKYAPIIFTLPYNYRSTDDICRISSGVAAGRTWCLTSAIRPTRGIPGRGIEMKTFATRREEMEFALAIGREEGYGNVTVLARNSGILHWLSILCTKQGIPFRRLMGGFIFDSREARHLLSYLRAGAGLDTDGSALRSIINVPFRYVSNKAFTAAARTGIANLLDALLECGELKYLPRRSVVKLKDILEKVKEFDTQDSPSHRSPAAILQWVIDKIEYEEYIAEEMGLTTATEDEGASIVLEELVEYAAGFSDIKEMLRHVDHLRELHEVQKGIFDTMDQTGKITLATIHSIKGLQSPTVILADVTYGRFPSSNSRKDALLGEEETRLLYVALSRAQDRLIITRTKVSSSTADSPFWRLIRKLVTP